MVQRQLVHLLSPGPAADKVDARHLVEAKQFEPLNLHTIMQQLRIDDFAWLKIPSNGRPNPDEAIKRRHLAEDLVFWLFNSYLVPLVKVRQIRTHGNGG